MDVCWRDLPAGAPAWKRSRPGSGGGRADCGQGEFIVFFFFPHSHVAHRSKKRGGFLNGGRDGNFPSPLRLA